MQGFDSKLSGGGPAPTSGSARLNAAHRLSVVIPNYNHMAVLPTAVGAFLNQTTPPREILVVDDCSTDESVAVVERIMAAHPTVRLVRRAERGGPNAASNTGLAEARGEFVTFAAADDWVEPPFAERSIGALDAFPKAAFCFLDGSSRILKTGESIRVPLALSDGPRYFDPNELERILRVNHFRICSNTVVYRRSTMATVNGFRADLQWQSDWMVNLVLAFRHGACYVPEAHAHFVVDTDGYSGRGTRSGEGQKRLLYRCLDLLESDYRDVRPRFRNAGMLPEMRLRDLVWLASDARGRRYLTRHLIQRLAMQEAWTYGRPLAPQRLRRWMRRRAARAHGASLA